MDLKLLQQLLHASNESELAVEALQKKSVSPQERALLRRCALARFFDAAVYKKVLCQGLTNVPQWSDFITAPELEQLGARPWLFRVRDGFRNSLLADCTPAEQEGTHRGLSAYYAKAESADDIERLYHLAAIDPPQAQELFVRAFADADRAFSLTRCSDLLSAIAEAQDAALPPLRQQYRAHLEARCLAADAYSRTTTFLDRPRLTKMLTGLLDSKVRWVLQFYGRGGQGKTATLRWFFARYCTQWERRIPCAYIDLDHENRQLLAEQPFRLLLLAAARLNPQLVDAPLGELIDDMRALAARAGAAGRGMDAEYVRERTAVYTGRFADIMSERDGHSVIILDTLEDLLLQYPDGLLAMISMFVELHARYTGLRLILSSRFDLYERLGGLALLLEKSSRSIEIPPFDERESLEYLQTQRRLPADAPLQAIVDCAAGSPFKLSLLADAFHANRDLGADELRSYHDVDLIYVIERVIARIPNLRVRWLLRYGVVPRRLTEGFLIEVMSGFLPDPQDGKPYHHLEEEALPPDKRRSLPLRSTPAAETTLSLPALWKELQKYASAYSWVSFGGNPQTLIFHSEVVRPLRRLLRTHEVFPRLHAAAADYYHELARREGEARAEHLAEELYHRFQLSGAAAGELWLKLVEEAAEAADFAIVYGLTREVLGPDYIDADHVPIADASGAPILTPETQALAYLYRARALLDPRMAGGPERHLAEIEQDLTRARARAQALPEQRHRFLLGLSYADLQAARRDWPAAAATLEATLRDSATPAQRLAVLSRHGDALAAQDLRGAAKHYQDALSIAQELGDRAMVTALCKRLSEHLARFGQHEHALATLRALPPPQDMDEEIGQACAMAEQLTLAGRPAEGLARLIGLPEPRKPSARLAAARGRALLAAQRPRAAAEACSALLARAAATVGDPPEVAVVHEVFAQALSALQMFDATNDAILKAASIYDRRDDQNGKERCRRLLIEFLLRQKGDCGEAADLVSRWPPALPTLTCARIEDELLTVEWLWLQGEQDQAAARLLELRRSMPAGAPPALRVELALWGLTVAREAAVPYLSMLQGALAEIDSAAARLRLVGRLSESRPLKAKVSHDLLALLDADELDRLHIEDRTFAWLRAADALHALGDDARGHERWQRAQEALHRFAHPPELILLSQFQAVAARIGAVVSEDPLRAAVVAENQGLWPGPIVQVSLEQAERALLEALASEGSSAYVDTDARRRARRWLNLARPVLGDRAGLQRSQWQLRALELEHVLVSLTDGNPADAAREAEAVLLKALQLRKRLNNLVASLIWRYSGELRPHLNLTAASRAGFLGSRREGLCLIIACRGVSQGGVLVKIDAFWSSAHVSGLQFYSRGLSGLLGSNSVKRVQYYNLIPLLNSEQELIHLADQLIDDYSATVLLRGLCLQAVKESVRIEIGLEYSPSDQLFDVLPWELILIRWLSRLCGNPASFRPCLYRMSGGAPLPQPPTHAGPPLARISTHHGLPGRAWGSLRQVSREGTSLSDSYRKQGFLIDDDPLHTQKMGADNRPLTILHLQYSFFEEELDWEGSLTAHREHELQELQIDAGTLILVEAVGAGSSSEENLQVLLRNGCAARLFQRGVAGAVLAVGPLLPASRSERYNQILAKLRGMSLAVLWQELWQGNLSDPVLFASDPDLCLFTQHERSDS